MKKWFLLILLYPCFAFSQVKTPDYYTPNFDKQLEIEFRSTFKQQQQFLLVGAGIFHAASLLNYYQHKQTTNYYHLTNSKISNTFALTIDFIILLRYVEEKYERKNNNYEWTH